MLGVTRSGAPLSDSLLGRKIGRYLIEEQIADGGQGTVYRAKTDTGGMVAIKTPTLVTEESLASMGREAEILASLNHPNIVRFIDFLASSEVQAPLLVMELIEGITLEHLIKTRSIGPKERMTILNEIAEALGYMHDKGVVHCDIKPENIIFGDRIKLVDFGLATYQESITDRRNMGTFHYMAPEQGIVMGSICTATDVYALGVIAYRMLSGSMPFYGIGLDVLVRQAAEDAPAISSRSLAGPDLDRVMGKVLHRDVRERYQSAKDFLAELVLALENGPTSLLPQSAVVLVDGADGHARTRLPVLD